MNKPIRTISLFCLVLFLALMLNATYLMYVRSGELTEDPQNRRVITAAFSRERGAILVGKDPVARSVPSDDEYDFQRVYPQPFKYAPLTGFFSYYSQTGIERSQNDVLSGDDSRLFVTRLVDMLSNTDPKGGNVQLTIDPEAQTAAYDGLRALGEDVQGAVVAHRAGHRQGPRDGLQPDVRPQHAGLARLRLRHRDLPGARAGPGRAAHQPRHRHHAAAGVDLQAGDRGRRDRVRRLRRRVDGARRHVVPAPAVHDQGRQPAAAATAAATGSP